MNARMENAYRSYKYSNMFELWDAYGRCSQAKRNAWEYCKAGKERLADLYIEGVRLW